MFQLFFKKQHSRKKKNLQERPWNHRQFDQAHEDKAQGLTLEPWWKLLQCFKAVPIPCWPPCSLADLPHAWRKAVEENVCKHLCHPHSQALLPVWSHLSGLISLKSQWQHTHNHAGDAAVVAEVLHMLLSTGPASIPVHRAGRAQGLVPDWAAPATFSTQVP